MHVWFKLVLAVTLFSGTTVFSMQPGQGHRVHKQRPIEKRLFSRTSKTRAAAQQEFIAAVTDPTEEGFLLKNATFRSVYHQISAYLTKPDPHYAQPYIAEFCKKLEDLFSRSEYRKSYHLGAAALTLATAILKTTTPACHSAARALAHRIIETLYYYGSGIMVNSRQVKLKVSALQSIGIATFWRL